MVAGARSVPNRQLLSIPFRSELIAALRKPTNDSYFSSSVSV